MKKKVLAVFLALAILFGCASTAFAAESDPSEEPANIDFADFDSVDGSKTARSTGNDDEYEVTLSVPGSDNVKKLYNEVIIMVDGSDSRSGDFTKLKEVLKTLGDELLNADGRTRITLMGFGFSSRTVGSFSDPEALDAFVDDPNFSSDDLLYGVSCTNIECAFNWINDYINNSQDLNQAVVLFTSDGESNMDEEPFEWAHWSQDVTWHGSNVSNETVVSLGIDGQSWAVLDNGAPLLDASVRLMTKYAPEVSLETLDEATMDSVNEVLTAHGVEWFDEIMTDMFAAKGLEYGPGKTATASQYEHALWDYLRALGNGYEARSGGVADMFLLSILGTMKYFTDYYSGSGNNNFGSRAAAACDKLGQNAKVKDIFLIGYKHYSGKEPATHWMNPASTVTSRVTSDKVTFIESTGTTDAIGKIQTEVEETIVTTPINNPAVYDPMSKWVDLEPESVSVWHNGSEIWNRTDGWLIPENERPVSGDPVTISENETTGKLDITWNIKDGALIAADRFALKYRVTIDREADDYVPGKYYELNNPTSVQYRNPAYPKLMTVRIRVPEVQIITEKPVNPETGDRSLAPVCAMLAVSVLMLAAVALEEKKRRV